MKIAQYLGAFSFILLITWACSSKESTLDSEAALQKEITTNETESAEPVRKRRPPHPYGGWYCPDNFGFEPVDISQLQLVEAISHRLPTEEELKDHKSLIKVDLQENPNAKALDMDLPRVARVYSNANGIYELAIIIQAIVVDVDTIVGYRFVNGGNGSAWYSDVEFLSENEVDNMGARPFFFGKQTLKASKEDIWRAMCRTDYARGLAEKFNQQFLFFAEWDQVQEAILEYESADEAANGFIGTVFGNAYLHIDYMRGDLHYSEKMLILENEEKGTTEVFFAAGPFPENGAVKQAEWQDWFNKLVASSEAERIRLAH